MSDSILPFWQRGSVSGEDDKPPFLDAFADFLLEFWLVQLVWVWQDPDGHALHERAKYLVSISVLYTANFAFAAVYRQVVVSCLFRIAIRQCSKWELRPSKPNYDRWRPHPVINSPGSYESSSIIRPATPYPTLPVVPEIDTYPNDIDSYDTFMSHPPAHPGKMTASREEMKEYLHRRLMWLDNEARWSEEALARLEVELDGEVAGWD
ncbi:hypothetical protein IAT38_002155 [Cryptococcus sp. DSM 104549]